MKKKLAIWQLISESLHDNIPVMLLYVLESTGSSPGRAGFGMAVNARGKMAGSIGGGIMEHKFVEMSLAKLVNDDHENTIHKQVHDKKALHHQSGMICSGEQIILLYKVQGRDIDNINKLVRCLEHNELSKLVLSSAGIGFSNDLSGPINGYMPSVKEDDWTYDEAIGNIQSIHIIGSGHCALALSKLMAELSFNVHIYDHRKNLNTFVANTFAVEKSLVDDYAELRNLIAPGNHTYVVSMTVGYRTDDLVIRTLIDKEYKFLGLMGSKKKVEKMIAEYVKEGFDDKLLKKIHAPVGLEINSHTPEEIAVSIAAQIIKVKNTNA